MYLITKACAVYTCNTNYLIWLVTVHWMDGWINKWQFSCDLSVIGNVHKGLINLNRSLNKPRLPLSEEHHLIFNNNVPSRLALAGFLFISVFLPVKHLPHVCSAPWRWRSWTPPTVSSRSSWMNHSFVRSGVEAPVQLPSEGDGGFWFASQYRDTWSELKFQSVRCSIEEHILIMWCVAVCLCWPSCVPPV